MAEPEAAGAGPGEPDEMVVTLPDGALYAFPKDVLKKHRMSEEKVQELLRTTPPPAPGAPSRVGGAGAAAGPGHPTVHVVGPVVVPEGAAVATAAQALQGVGQPAGRPVGQPVVHVMEVEAAAETAGAARAGVGMPIVQVMGPIVVPEGTPAAAAFPLPGVMPGAMPAGGGGMRAFGPTVISGP